MIEEEAKKRHCPMTFNQGGATDDIDYRCVGSKCMWWVAIDFDTKNGTCAIRRI